MLDYNALLNNEVTIPIRKWLELLKDKKINVSDISGFEYIISNDYEEDSKIKIKFKSLPVNYLIEELGNRKYV